MARQRLLRVVTAAGRQAALLHSVGVTALGGIPELRAALAELEGEGD